MNGGNRSAAELFEERKTRIVDAIELREPDRVPSIMFSTFWAAKHAGMSCEEAMHDYTGLSDAMRKAILELEPDAYQPCHPVISTAPTMELMGYKQLRWPGQAGFDPNVSYQYLDNEYMLASEYDEYLFDPTGFYLRKYLPRIAGVYEPFESFPDYPAFFYLRHMHAVAYYAQPDVRKALEALIKAGEEAQEMLTEARLFTRQMNELGFPVAAGVSSGAPFDVLGDYMRGSKGVMLDMFRNKDKLLAAVNKMTEFVSQGIVANAAKFASRICFIPLHWGLDGFMSPEQFKTFYWPSLRELMLRLIDAGLTPCPFWEGDCTSRLEIIKDIPAGKCIYFFERTDLFKAKEILGDTVCIRGGVPASLLNTGKPAEVQDHCKKLIDVVGAGGGYIMDASVGIPDEAKPGNVRAMFETTREYGVYH